MADMTMSDLLVQAQVCASVLSGPKSSSLTVQKARRGCVHYLDLFYYHREASCTLAVHAHLLHTDIQKDRHVSHGIEYYLRNHLPHRIPGALLSSVTGVGP